MQTVLFFYKPGKLISGDLSTAQSPQALPNNRTFFLTDSISQARRLVDTGVVCCIWPLKLSVSQISLQTVNHSPIPTYGQISRSLDLKLVRDFTWTFTIADLPYSILGSDFLHHYNLLVNMRRRRLIDANTEPSVPGLKSTVLFINPVFFIAASNGPFQELLSSFPEMTTLNFVVSKPTHFISRPLPSLCVFKSSSPLCGIIKSSEV